MQESQRTFFIMELSPLRLKYCAGHNSHTVLDNLIIFGRMKRWTSRRVASKRDKSHFPRYLVISPEAEILCRPYLPYFLRQIVNIW